MTTAVSALGRLLGTRTITHAAVPGMPRPGAPVSQLGLQPGPGAALSTADRLTLGDTVAQAEQLDGAGFSAVLEKSGTGAWTADLSGGSVSGALMPNRDPMTRLTPSTEIGTVTAGQAGCG